ncbi:MAG: DNA methylase [Oscillospiraceae bacterium]|nr:DNA methylase [Oscillospiraceae bacterium]
MSNRIYAAIDLKSFYASVECIQRGLDPLTTNLLVADASRTEKTICLAVSPSLKSFGIPGRPRLFEAVQKVSEANALRKMKLGSRPFSGKSWDFIQLQADPTLAIDYITAPPRMAMYMETSTKIYEIYLKYVAPEDMHVYSIDEVFLDLTPYLKTSGLSAYDFVRRILLDVLDTTGITAAAGIGTNLYLCKVAMDIVAKHVEADADGVRIAELDEMRYRKLLWDHQPLTDFWRVGRGYTRKLAKHGIFTMGDIARCSLGKPGEFYSQELLYKLFGVNAELLIDHAWGVESCTIADIKAYRPESSSLGSGQVLHCAYSPEKAKLVTREMTDLLVLDLVDKGLVTDQMVLTVGYDIDNLLDPERAKRYRGAVVTDHYGRKIPKHAHGTVHLDGYTSSTREITEAVMELFDRIVNPELLVRRLNIVACHILRESEAREKAPMEQLDLFTRPEDDREERRQREKRRQQAVIGIQKKYGKNALLRGMNLEEGATARDRNRQIGGHKA